MRSTTAPQPCRRQTRRIVWARLFLVVVTVVGIQRATLVAAATPPSFSDTLVTAVELPTALAFTSDSRLLIASQPGRLRVYQNGSLLSTPAIDLSAKICDDVERGLLGVAVDPGFASNHFVYLYYTFNKFDACPTSPSPSLPVNRVSRFTLPGSSVIDPASEVVLVDNILTVYGNHNAGDLHFGPDGLLYISIGDGGGSAPADDLDKLAGKILRVGADGSIPAGNPFANTAGARRCGDPAGVPAGNGPCKEIIAYGLRNPFRFAFKPGSGSFYINDVGQDTWEEIDEWSGTAGGAPNYGWPTREGPCDQYNSDDCSAPPAGMTNPIHSYNHDTGCGAITGGAIVPNGFWPAEYDGAYLFSDYTCGKIFRRAPNGTVTEFVTGLGGSSAVTLVFGPHGAGQALYYTNYWGTNGAGQVRRVAYTGNLNRPPTAAIGATPVFGAAPLNVAFSAAGSADPDGDPLTYDWDFDDGAVLNGSSNTSPTHGYTQNGIYTAALTVRDNHGGVSQQATIRIDVGNTPPIPQIQAPAPSARFVVGQPIALQGSASDAQDGGLPPAALSWQVLLHHVDEQNPGNAHTHPLLAPTTGATVTVNGPAAEDLRATKFSFLEIRLTATDTWGRSTTITQTLEPQRVDVALATEPAGLSLLVNNAPFATPRTLISWQGHKLQLGAPGQLNADGWWVWSAWSDGGAATHTITTPAATMTYTATFEPALVVFLPAARR
jgi:glucose/arabinose dehydrogenase